MPVSLAKGGNVSLSKESPGLRAVAVGLGWDTRVTDGSAFDLDASVFVLGEGGAVRSDADFIFYNQLRSVEGSVEHQGDNRTGQGDGDDEGLKIDLSLMPSEIQRIPVTVTIHDAEVRKQNFGQVGNAFIRIVNSDTNHEVVRFDLSEDSSTETAMVFGELYRNGAEWKFRAVGQGYAGGLSAMCRQYGVNAA